MSGTVDWNGIRGEQLKLLRNAILRDFGEASLNAALLLEFEDQPLDNYAAAGLFPHRVLALIQTVKQHGHVREFLDALVRANRDGAGLRHFRETVGLTAAFDRRAPQGWTLEDVVRPDAGFLKPDGWLAKLAALRRRVCRIEHPHWGVEKPGFGTGWLIGPDLLLTNWHVIRHFRPVDGAALDAAGITCRFDVPEPPEPGTGRTCRLAADWLVHASLPGEAERDKEGVAPPTADELDFAVVRLDQRVGDDVVARDTPRGRVDLATRGKTPRDGDVALIVQHPQGMPQRFAFGNVVGNPGPDERRLQHDANTLGGSSGSPMVDVKLDIVALHHAGGRSNQAVPIALVADRLAAQGVALG